MIKSVKIGITLTNSTNKTIKVLLKTKKLIHKYSLIKTIFKYYLVHDELNICKKGDIVLFSESRPISKNKYHKLIKKL